MFASSQPSTARNTNFTNMVSHNNNNSSAAAAANPLTSTAFAAYQKLATTNRLYMFLDDETTWFCDPQNYLHIYFTYEYNLSTKQEKAKEEVSALIYTILYDIVYSCYMETVNAYLQLPEEEKRRAVLKQIPSVALGKGMQWFSSNTTNSIVSTLNNNNNNNNNNAEQGGEEGREGEEKGKDGTAANAATAQKVNNNKIKEQVLQALLRQWPHEAQEVKGKDGADSKISGPFFGVPSVYFCIDIIASRKTMTASPTTAAPTATVGAGNANVTNDNLQTASMPPVKSSADTSSQVGPYALAQYIYELLDSQDVSFASSQEDQQRSNSNGDNTNNNYNNNNNNDDENNLFNNDNNNNNSNSLSDNNNNLMDSEGNNNNNNNEVANESTTVNDANYVKMMGSIIGVSDSVNKLVIRDVLFPFRRVNHHRSTATSLSTSNTFSTGPSNANNNNRGNNNLIISRAVKLAAAQAVDQIDQNRLMICFPKRGM